MEKLRKFGEWWKNYFWYHFKGPILIILAVGIVIALGVGSMLTADRYDVSYVLACNLFYWDEELAPLDEKLMAVIGDQNGDGKEMARRIYCRVVEQPRTDGETAEVAKLMAAYQMSEVRLMILDRETFAKYNDPSAYIPLSPLGFAPEADGISVPVVNPDALGILRGIEDAKDSEFVALLKNVGDRGETPLEEFYRAELMLLRYLTGTE